MRKPRVSDSFNEEHVQLLSFITETLLRGGDPIMATRHKHFPGLAAKVGRLRQKMNEKKKGNQRQGGEHAEGTGEGSREADSEVDRGVPVGRGGLGPGECVERDGGGGQGNTH